MTCVFPFVIASECEATSRNTNPHYPYFLFGGKKKVTKKKPLLSIRIRGTKDSHALLLLILPMLSGAYELRS